MPLFGVFAPLGAENAPSPTLQTYGFDVTRTISATYRKTIFKENGSIISSRALGLISVFSNNVCG